MKNSQTMNTKDYKGEDERRRQQIKNKWCLIL